MGELARRTVRGVDTSKAVDAFTASTGRASGSVTKFTVTNRFKNKMDGRPIKVFGAFNYSGSSGYGVANNTIYYGESKLNKANISVVETEAELTATCGINVSDYYSLVFAKGI